MLYVTKSDYEQARLIELTETGRSAIVPLIDENIKDFLTPPINDSAATRLISTTKVNGLAIYSTDLNLLKMYGEPVVITLINRDNLTRTYRSPDGSSYEVVFRNNALRRPFVMVARLDSSAINGQVQDYVEQTILIMLLMSAFVTSVLMVALGL